MQKTLCYDEIVVTPNWGYHILPDKIDKSFRTWSSLKKHPFNLRCLRAVSCFKCSSNRENPESKMVVILRSNLCTPQMGPKNVKKNLRFSIVLSQNLFSCYLLAWLKEYEGFAWKNYHRIISDMNVFKLNDYFF